MTGADALIRSLLSSGVNVCFTNPGTSEMHFVGALDRIGEMRCVLALFEGVATGAADGYGRMTGRPASTLMHLGPGLANGVANLHNASRANTPIVNVVGEHATWHRRFDPPLASSIESIARAHSSWWSKVSESAAETGADAAQAVMQSLKAPGRISTLILPADSAWNEGGVVAGPVAPPARSKVDDARIARAAQMLRDGSAALLLNGPMLLGEATELCGKVAAATGAELLAPTQIPRVERGAGRVNVDRVPYVIEHAVKRLARIRNLVMVNATQPIAFFAYPGKPSTTTPEGCNLFTLADPLEDGVDAVRRLVDRLGAGGTAARREPREKQALPTGPITLPGIAAVIAGCITEGTIVVDESVTSGRGLVPATKSSAPHDWITNTGGSIGFAMPVAIGAAVACPGRKVLCLEGDGSGMYTNQALWTMARERLDVVSVIFANRTYEILKGEYRNVGAGTLGERALSMLEIGDPALDWVRLATAQGVEAVRVGDLDQLASHLRRAMGEHGPRLIEVAMA
jgi:acetolactate synthase I/II/III large subunit